ncbi:LRAT domain-containing protein [Aphelenchoides besseyi]|nr:LRAT domain-containing protein [Aphelenchoides besseyi]
MSSVTARPLETEWMTADRLVEHLQPGDLIEIRRFAQLEYAHWALYLGEDQGVPEVIHFATAFGDFGPQMEMLNAQMQNGNQNYLESILSNPMAHIRLDSLHDVVGGSIARINHSLDKKHPPFPAEIIIERALSKLDTHGYHLVSNNCEHFVNWCRYDKPISQQVNSHLGMLNSFMRVITAPHQPLHVNQNNGNSNSGPQDDMPLD